VTFIAACRVRAHHIHHAVIVKLHSSAAVSIADVRESFVWAMQQVAIDGLLASKLERSLWLL
jgi:hypothetical protein